MEGTTEDIPILSKNQQSIMDYFYYCLGIKLALVDKDGFVINDKFNIGNKEELKDLLGIKFDFLGGQKRYVFYEYEKGFFIVGYPIISHNKCIAMLYASSFPSEAILLNVEDPYKIKSKKGKDIFLLDRIPVFKDERLIMISNFVNSLSTQLEEYYKLNLRIHRLEDFIGKVYPHDVISNLLNADLGGFEKYNAIYEQFKKWNNEDVDFNKEGFFLVYQPIFDLENDEMRSIEALVRWNHPKFGIVMPGDFIPVAEETGLIIKLGKWVLDKACMENKNWQTMGLPHVSVAVNISPLQLQDVKFKDDVLSALEKARLNPKYLELELTENTLLILRKHTMMSLNTFRDLGIKVAIDDFGKGYSSLNRFRSIPADIIKIDKAFIGDIYSSEYEHIVVQHIIGFAHRFGYEVVAEGVEKEEQLEVLKEMQCDRVQGFLLGKPQHISKIEKCLN